MKKNGFTLVELLAVIVILAIIALIAVPIVIHIINDSKASSEKESLKLYQDSVQKAITKKQMNNPSFNPDKCEIKDKGNLECFKGTISLGIIEIEMKGQVPSSGTVIIEGNNIKYENIVLNEKTFYKKESNATLVSDAAPTGVSYGDKYTYKVNDTDTFYFYVLSFNDDDTVNLIMDRNICGSATDGNASTNGQLATETNPCYIGWFSGTNTNYNGPLTAMAGLYNATKGWTNVPNMNLEYDAISDLTSSGYTGNTTYGYIGITITDGKGYITFQDRSIYELTSTDNMPIKARLPKYSEVYNVDTTDTIHCHDTKGSCPSWLTNGLRSYSSSMYSENEHIRSIEGYWLLSADREDSIRAYLLWYYGNLYKDDTTHTSYNAVGIRPVITVPKSDLE